MHRLGFYISFYVIWLFVYVLPAAVIVAFSWHFATRSLLATRIVQLLIVCLVIAFPPLEKLGTWQKEATGQQATGLSRWHLDRFWYGYAPQYRWIGALFAPDIPDHGRSSVIGESGYYRLLSSRYGVSLMYFLPECVLVAIGIWSLNRRLINRLHARNS